MVLEVDGTMDRRDNNKISLERDRSSEGEDFVVKNDRLAWLFYESGDDKTLRDNGLNPTKVSEWLESLANHRIPKGYDSLEQFEAAVIKMIEEHKRNK